MSGLSLFSSERCRSELRPDESATLLVCTLSHGHHGPHENGSWEWWDEATESFRDDEAQEHRYGR